MYTFPAGTSSRDYPLIKGHQFYDRRRAGGILGIVLHVTAGLQDLDAHNDDSAEGTNRWGAQGSVQASWHCCVDSDSIAPALPATYTAWHVVGYNSRTWGLEISNRDARWDNKPAAWVDATIRNAAKACAPIVKANGLPLTLVGKSGVDAAIHANRPFGFSYHMWLNPQTRTDPGKTFPWDLFLRYLKAELAGSTKPAPAPKDWFDMATRDDLKAAIREVIAEEATARAIFTKHRIVRDVNAGDPQTAPRVAPSTLLEQAAKRETGE